MIHYFVNVSYIQQGKRMIIINSIVLKDWPPKSRRVMSPHSRYRALWLLYRLFQTTGIFYSPGDTIATAAAQFGEATRQVGGVVFNVKWRYLNIDTLLFKNASVLFIEFTEMHWRETYSNGFLFQYSWRIWDGNWVLGKSRNDEFLVYIFTGKVQNVTPSIFSKSLYHCWLD